MVAINVPLGRDIRGSCAEWRDSITREDWLSSAQESCSGHSTASNQLR